MARRKTSLGKAAMSSRPQILYRFYDRTDVLLYVGITVNLEQRMEKHTAEKDWWPQVDRSSTRIEYYDSRRAALDAEREAIKAEKPLHNDHHNEWAEEDSEEDELWELCCELLSWLPDQVRQEALNDAAEDWDGNRVSSRDQDIAAGKTVVTYFWRALRDLSELVDEYLDLLPDSEGELHKERARQEYYARTADEKYPNYHPMDISTFAMQSLVKAAAGRVLSAMPRAEALEWIAASEALGIKEDGKPVVFGARRAAIYKAGFDFTRLCRGPGKHGARCPRKADTKTYFEICADCTRGEETPCSGHTIWCEEHAEAATLGELGTLRDTFAATQPILRSEPLTAAALEVPF